MDYKNRRTVVLLPRLVVIVVVVVVEVQIQVQEEEEEEVVASTRPHGSPAECVFYARGNAIVWEPVAISAHRAFVVLRVL